MPVSSTAFNDLVQKELYKNTFPDGTQPLYHYTTLDTFKNILNSESLWLTDIRFVNDASEYTYGLGIIMDILKNYFQQEKYKSLLPSNFTLENQQILKAQLGVVAKSLLDHSQSLDADLKKGNLFIFCLSPNSDQQTQWTNYAGEGGIAIGFDTDTLSGSVELIRYLIITSLTNKILSLPCIGSIYLVLLTLNILSLKFGSDQVEINQLILIV